MQVETRVERISGGPFADVVNRVADEEGASLVALGRRGQGVVATLLVGKFAADILRYGRHDVLLMHSPADPKGRTAEEVDACSGLFSRVMICTDFSSPEIVSFCAETLPRDAEIILFHAIETGESVRRCLIAALLRGHGSRTWLGRSSPGAVPSASRSMSGTPPMRSSSSPGKKRSP